MYVYAYIHIYIERERERKDRDIIDIIGTTQLLTMYNASF